jgi:aryl-alcohol dehydrogenase-like predicted oxidoreductase
VLAQACVDAAIIGPRTPDHLDAAMQALSVSISPEEGTRLAGLFS